MSMDKLGVRFDIHGGGSDLIFPHHENEIAQSEAVTGKQHVNYWIHNGFVNINNEKMSKSLNNFFTLRDVLKDYSGEVIRLFILGTHYHSPINFELKFLDEAKRKWQRLYDTANKSDLIDIHDSKDIDNYKRLFLTAMDDDFNAAEALGHIFSLTKYINKTSSLQAVKLMRELLQIIGINLESVTDSIPKEIELLLEKRNQARKDKDFALSDQLRDQLQKLGYEIKDTAQGSELKKLL